MTDVSLNNDNDVSRDVDDVQTDASDDISSAGITPGVTPLFDCNDRRCESVYEHVSRHFDDSKNNFDLTIEKFQFLRKVDVDDDVDVKVQSRAQDVRNEVGWNL